ncbi:MAG: DUF5916 domain-containing protein [Egibacteraceae bacterium]
MIAAALGVALPCVGPTVAAQQSTLSPAPDPAAVKWHDATGRVMVRATRVAVPPRVDGVLDDDVYAAVTPISGFIQQDPVEGVPATEQTLVWLLFDEDTLYISARCRDSQPSRVVANDMRRDGRNVGHNDNLSVSLDTFHDRRNGYEFLVNAIGGAWDTQVTDERDANRDWNTVWRARSGRDDQGWMVEMAIPFRSLRYPGSGPQTWGINVRRNVRWKNEISYLNAIPRSFGLRGILLFSQAATLVGLETPPPGLNLEFKPYGVSSVTADRAVDPTFANDLTGNAGLDMKYVLSQSLSADLTFRTDFAQVEDDDLQVNLTRFNLFFPEKREFFLEGRGIFAFGGAQTSSTTGSTLPSNTPVLFFSRRIGLQDGDVVPIDVGGRLTGRVGPYSIGLIDVRTGDGPGNGPQGLPTNFSVVRVKRDILRRSYIGAMATHRTHTLTGGDNTAMGVDANLNLHQYLNVVGYYAETRTPGQRTGDRSHRLRVAYDADLLGIEAERLAVGEAFNPDVGFLRRSNFIEHLGQIRLSRRPKTVSAVRKVSLESAFDYITDTDQRLMNREARVGLRTDMQTGDTWNVQFTRGLEVIPTDFLVVGTRVPRGTYDASTVGGVYTAGTQRRISGEVAAARGGVYGGDRTEFSVRSRAEISTRLSVEPTVSLNWVDLPTGSFRATLVSARGVLSFTPRMLVASLIQYTSSGDLLTTNIRYRWEYRPGSELFVVYSDGRDTRSGLGGGVFPVLRNRGLTIKLTRLFRM